MAKPTLSRILAVMLAAIAASIGLVGNDLCRSESALARPLTLPSARDQLREQAAEPSCDELPDGQ